MIRYFPPLKLSEDLKEISLFKIISLKSPSKIALKKIMKEVLKNQPVQCATVFKKGA